MKTIFCDGIFDMVHFGHVEHLKKAKTLFEDVFLIVGLTGDEDATGYKRKPIMDHKTRCDIIKSIRYVDKIIPNCPMYLTEEFIKEHKIDLVVHGFKDNNDCAKQGGYYDVPIKMNIMRELPYTEGISTTDIIEGNIEHLDKNEWKYIWTSKGVNDSADLGFCSGYNNTGMDPVETTDNIKQNLGITKDSKILEVGCGCGYIGQYFTDYDYTGIDYSSSLAFKHFNILKNKVIIQEAYPLPFSDNQFDVSFSIGVFEYFPSIEYTKNVIEEMLRVSKHGVYILNMRLNSDKDTSKYEHEGNFSHNILTKAFFTNNCWNIKESTWDKDNRFSAIFIDKP